MSKNPILNALAAAGYIVLVACVMFFGTSRTSGPDTFLAPIVFLSVFTLSAAVMGYLFLYQPVMLFIDGKKKQAVNLFLQTVGIFAVLTAIGLTLLFSGLIK